MPTGSGKSLTYQTLPIVFYCLSEGSPQCNGQPKMNILIVVLPLVNLMKDQVDRLNALGIKAISLSLISSANEENDLPNGRYSIVYGSPESWLLNEKRRSMLLSDSYSKKICAVAVDSLIFSTGCFQVGVTPPSSHPSKRPANQPQCQL